MKLLTIELDNNVAHVLEVRAAIDDLTLKQGIEALLTELVEVFKERSKS